jgi:hypothetical protein
MVRLLQIVGKRHDPIDEPVQVDDLLSFPSPAVEGLAQVQLERQPFFEVKPDDTIFRDYVSRINPMTG